MSKKDKSIHLKVSQLMRYSDLLLLTSFLISLAYIFVLLLNRFFVWDLLFVRPISNLSNIEIS